MSILSWGRATLHSTPPVSDVVGDTCSPSCDVRSTRWTCFGAVDVDSRLVYHRAGRQGATLLHRREALTQGLEGRSHPCFSGSRGGCIWQVHVFVAASVFPCQPPARAHKAALSARPSCSFLTAGQQHQPVEALNSTHSDKPASWIQPLLTSLCQAF